MLSQRGYQQRQVLKKTIKPNPNFNKRVFPSYLKNGKRFTVDAPKKMTKSTQPQKKAGPSKNYNGSKSRK